MDESEEILRKVSQAWDEAQLRFGDLKQRVVAMERLTAAKVQVDANARALERAFRDLGESFWRHLLTIPQPPPPGTEEAVRSVRACLEEASAQRGRIQELLLEGEETAARLGAERETSKSAVETRSKKR